MQDRFLQFLGIIKKSGNLIEGYNKCQEIIGRKNIFLVIISTDCSTNTKEKFIKLCNNNEIPYIEAYEKELLGASIGRNEISLLAIKDKNMGNKLLSLANKNETI